MRIASIGKGEKMKNFKKEVNILIKRNGFWLLLSFILGLIFLGLSQMKSLEGSHKSIIDSANSLNKLAGIEERYDEKTLVNEDFYKKLDPVFEKMAKKYDYKKYIAYINEKNASMDEIEEYDKMTEKNRDSLYILENYEIVRDNLSYKKEFFFYDYIVLMGFFFIVILGALFTSLEHATSYYEFSKTFPWTKKKDFLMKFALGLGFILAFLLVGSILSFMVFQGSNFEIENLFKGLLSSFVKSFGFLTASFLVVLSTGFMAGNILGHAILTLVTFFFVDILDGLVSNLYNVFTGNVLSYDEGIYGIIDEIIPAGSGRFNEMLRTILRPMNEYSYEWHSLLGYIIFALICFLISYNLIGKIKTEKSGVMVLFKAFEILIKTMLVLLFASIGALIFQSTIFEGFSPVSILIFALLAFVFAKIFNILFKIRLKV